MIEPSSSCHTEDQDFMMTLTTNLHLNLMLLGKIHTLPGFGTQPYYKAPGNIQVELAQAQ